MTMETTDAGGGTDEVATPRSTSVPLDLSAELDGASWASIAATMMIDAARNAMEETAAGKEVAWATVTDHQAMIYGAAKALAAALDLNARVAPLGYRNRRLRAELGDWLEIQDVFLDDEPTPMPAPNTGRTDDRSKYCSFCGGSESAVDYLAHGPAGIAICSNCVDLIITERAASSAAGAPQVAQDHTGRELDHDGD